MTLDDEDKRSRARRDQQPDMGSQAIRDKLDQGISKMRGKVHWEYRGPSSSGLFLYWVLVPHGQGGRAVEVKTVNRAEFYASMLKVEG